MNKQLQKLIDLSNKTGDRLIVFDPTKPNNAYVIMGVDDYEKIIIGQAEVRGLTEDELLDKINRDIAIWKSNKIDDQTVIDSANYYNDNNNNDDDDKDLASVSADKEDDWYSVDEITKMSNYDKVKEIDNLKKRKGPWRIPSERKEKAEEIIEEDRYYLEDLED